MNALLIPFSVRIPDEVYASILDLAEQGHSAYSNALIVPTSRLTEDQLLDLVTKGATEVDAEGFVMYCYPSGGKAFERDLQSLQCAHHLCAYRSSIDANQVSEPALAIYFYRVPKAVLSEQPA